MPSNKKRFAQPIDIEKDLVLVVGALGTLGSKLVHELLERNYSVRIIARSMERAKRSFSENIFNRLEGVHICNIENESYFESQALPGEGYSFSESLLEAFKSDANRKQKLKYVISILGMNSTNHNSKLIDYEANKLLIDLSKSHNVEKFIYVSSLFVSMPYHPMSIMISAFLDNSLTNKLKTENYLRGLKGLDYVIVRPGTLYDAESKLEKNIEKINT